MGDQRAGFFSRMLDIFDPSPWGNRRSVLDHEMSTTRITRLGAQEKAVHTWTRSPNVQPINSSTRPTPPSRHSHPKHPSSSSTATINPGLRATPHPHSHPLLTPRKQSRSSPRPRQSASTPLARIPSTAAPPAARSPRCAASR